MTSDLLGAGGQVEPRVGLGVLLLAAGLARPRPQAQPLALHPQPELGALAARRLRAAPATLLAQTDTVRGYYMSVIMSQ